MAPLLEKDYFSGYYDDDESGDDDEGENEEDDLRVLDADLLNNWARRVPYAVKKVERALKAADLTNDAVLAAALWENIGIIGRIDQMGAAAEARRNAVLREIDRHRESLAGQMRRKLPEIEGEIAVIEPNLNRSG